MNDFALIIGIVGSFASIYALIQTVRDFWKRKKFKKAIVDLVILILVVLITLFSFNYWKSSEGSNSLNYDSESDIFNCMSENNIMDLVKSNKLEEEDIVLRCLSLIETIDTVINGESIIRRMYKISYGHQKSTDLKHFFTIQTILFHGYDHLGKMVALSTTDGDMYLQIKRKLKIKPDLMITDQEGYQKSYKNFNYLIHTDNSNTKDGGITYRVVISTHQFNKLFNK